MRPPAPPIPIRLYALVVATVPAMSPADPPCSYRGSCQRRSYCTRLAVPAVLDQSASRAAGGHDVVGDGVVDGGHDVPTLSIPPPYCVAVLPAIVLLTSISVPVRLLEMPPPPTARLLAMVLAVTDSMPSFQIPPPKVPVLSWIVVFVIVRLPVLLLSMPPP